MEDVENHIEVLKKKASDIKGLNQSILGDRVSFTENSISILMESIRDVFEEFTDTQESKEYFDKSLGKQIGDAIEKALTTLAKVQTKAPVVNISPAQVNIDFKPIAESLTKQNDAIISLMSKYNGNDKSAELYKAVISMVADQRALMNRAEKEIDYTNKFTELIAAIKESKPQIDKLKIKRDQYNNLEVVPQYKS